MLLGGACCSRTLPQLIKRSVLINFRNSRRHFEFGSGRNEIGESAKYFSRPAVEKAFRIDRLNGEQWFLIYNDAQGVYRSLLPQLLLLLPFAALLYDQLAQDGSRWRTFKRSYRNYMTWMPFMVLPLISLCILFRIRQACLLRIYQSRKNPTEFLAVAPRLFFGKRQVHFAQGDAVALPPGDDQRVIVTIVTGNLKIKGKGFMSDNDTYRSNMLRSCMLNELSPRPPPSSM